MLYEEKVPFQIGKVIVVIFPLTAIYMFVLAYLQVKNGQIGDKPAPTWFYLLMGFFFLGFTWLISQFTSLSIRIEEKTILLSYGIIKAQISRDNIEKAYIDTANPLLSYGGWGYRLGYFKGRPRTALNIPGYRCVVITQKNVRREIVFSTGNPEKVIQLLQPAQT